MGNCRGWKTQSRGAATPFRPADAPLLREKKKKEKDEKKKKKKKGKTRYRGNNVAGRVTREFLNSSSKRRLDENGSLAELATKYFFSLRDVRATGFPRVAGMHN
ncbi:hypothetical protein PUN28_018825 [Cardiocondyla obscurior]|uniref:Uncharacterized protein n=1 Tax=Cardiocondyla obscurior TaxID=286306 RepID=A0AAW2EC95_9HYME